MKGILKDKRNVVLLVMGIICIVSVIVGITYAYIAYYTRQKGINIIESECIKIEMEELTDAINLVGAYPISNESVDKLKPFTFKLTNTCSMSVDYNINLEVLNIENRMPSNNVGSRVDESEIKVLTEEIKTEVTETEEYDAVESYTIGNGSLKPQESRTHEVRVWIHESAGNESQNKSFHSKVVIVSTPTLQAIYNFSDYLISLTKTEEDRGIEKVSHEDTIQTLNNANIDYRYVGANPNNYVYFGCEGNEESPCTNDNLYRIIGVIPTQSSSDGEYENRVKLIKATNWAGTKASNTSYSVSGKGYLWNTTDSNAWESSSLKGILNGEYYNGLGDYQNYIAPTKWYLGAPTYTKFKTYTPEQFYTLERSNTKGKSGGAISYVGNIGLMYPSDYGYSIGIEYRAESLYNNAEEYISNAWLYQLEGKYYEWTITPEATSLENGAVAWPVRSNGYVYTKYGVSYGNSFGARPTFFLKASVQYASGDGSIDNPYRIGL